MRRPASPSRAGQALRSPEPGLKDAVRRLRRSPAAILDAGLSAARSKATAGTKERRLLPNQGTRLGRPTGGARCRLS